MTSLPMITSPATLVGIAMLNILIMSQGCTLPATLPAKGSLDNTCVREPDNGSCTAQLVVYEQASFRGQYYLLYRGHSTRNGFGEALGKLWNTVVAGTSSAMVEEGWVVYEG